ncbi:MULTISPECIES: hypothetical protein [Pseudomonadota]|uniref:hypothetical protein n=1 Tax=Pseudomonadota TaxID=1224 RepID=UPI002614E959|nr:MULTISPECIES: hypothetical protein [Pseudomonadota]
MANNTRETIARVIAESIGPPFDKVHRDKQHWLKERGMFDGEHRDVNGPFQDHYMDAADAILAALEPAPVGGDVRERVELKNKIVSAILSYPPDTMSKAEFMADEILTALSAKTAR